MDPISAIRVAVGVLQLLSGVDSATPKAIDSPVAMESSGSLPAAAEQILHCYYREAQFQSVRVVQKPWLEGFRYRAINSALLRIKWEDPSHHPNKTQIAIVVRGGEARAVIEEDSSKSSEDRKCQINRWNSINASSAE